MMINNDWEKICKKSVVDNTEVLPPQHFSGVTEKSRVKSTSVRGGMGSVPFHMRVFCQSGAVTSFSPIISPLIIIPPMLVSNA